MHAAYIYYNVLRSVPYQTTWQPCTPTTHSCEAVSVHPGTPQVGPTPEVLPRLFQCCFAQAESHGPSSASGERALYVVRSVRFSCAHSSATSDGLLFDVSTFSPEVHSSVATRCSQPKHNVYIHTSYIYIMRVCELMAKTRRGCGGGRTEVCGLVEEAGDEMSPLLHRAVVLWAPAWQTTADVRLCVIGKATGPVSRRWRPAAVLFMPPLQGRYKYKRVVSTFLLIIMRRVHTHSNIVISRRSCAREVWWRYMRDLDFTYIRRWLLAVSRRPRLRS